MTDWRAQVGDGVAVESHRVHGGRRRGEIVEVLGSPGGEYYRVRWEDGRETLLHPGPDAVLEPKGRRRPKAAAKPAPGRRKPEPPAPAEAPRRHVLRASPGDRLVIKGHHLGEPDRDGEILEALGEDGGSPFKVRWSDTGREALVFPGTDAVVEHFARRRRSAARKG